MTVEKKSSVYTRTGDKGWTSLYNNERRKKSDKIFEVIGTIDELNSEIGLFDSSTQHRCLRDIAIQIMQDLFDIGSNLATPSGSEKKLDRVKFSSNKIEHLEIIINKLDSELSSLKNFILPGGSKDSAQLHKCRAVCRRAERKLIKYADACSDACLNDACSNDVHIDKYVCMYMNRLSDLFFVMARYANKLLRIEDMIYQKTQ